MPFAVLVDLKSAFYMFSPNKIFIKLAKCELSQNMLYLIRAILQEKSANINNEMA